MKAKISAAAINGLIGGLISAVVSALLNYYLLPFPETPLDNVIGHGIGGFFCGFISCVIGIMIYASQHASQINTDKAV
jgi:predicted CDP-diglyceride synthetase/phosphatidate cytidylyltransferase